MEENTVYSIISAEGNLHYSDAFWLKIINLKEYFWNMMINSVFLLVNILYNF